MIVEILAFVFFFFFWVLQSAFPLGGIFFNNESFYLVK